MDWYYASGGEHKGPVSEDELIDLFRLGQVKDWDLVWNDTMTDWVALKNVPELATAGKNDESASEPCRMHTTIGFETKLGYGDWWPSS